MCVLISVAVSLFSHIIFAHLYIFILILIVSPDSFGPLLCVCSWCEKSLSYFILNIEACHVNILHNWTVMTYDLVG